MFSFAIQGSCNNEGGAAKASNGSASGCAMSSPATVNIPARIHSVTQQYMSHTNYILMSHDLWDQADVQMADHNGESNWKTGNKLAQKGGSDNWKTGTKIKEDESDKNWKQGM